MFSRWSVYTLRMRNSRKRYLALFRKALEHEKVKAFRSMRKKMFRFTMITVGFGTFCFNAKQFITNYYEVNYIKRTFITEHPSQTKIIFTSEIDPQILQMASQTNDKIQISQIPPSSSTEKLIHKFGDYIIIFSPSNQSQLFQAIEKCYKNRHRVIFGCYSQLNDGQKMVKQLEKMPTPSKTQKYLIVDISKLTSKQINKNNHTIQVQAGCIASQLNELLEKQGYEPLVDECFGENSIHEIIVNNYPLKNRKSLRENLLNLTSVFDNGKSFTISTEVNEFGQISNLASFFIGTGNAIAVPVSLKLKIQPQEEKLQSMYVFETNDTNQLILQLRKLNKNIQGYQLRKGEQSQKILQCDEKQKIPTSLSLKKIDRKPEKINPSLIFNINNGIFEHFLLQEPEFANIQYTYQQGLLYVNLQRQKSQKLISSLTLHGGVLVWCKNRCLYRKMKGETDGTEVGHQLMKKIVETKEILDKKQTFESHERYEKYFSKGFFRKITQLFW